ncbi:MAG TPA: hypothetical protein VFT42_02990 [Solirubrobacteraceae bacterium]|nr:hypothetical protein [Solirubrobacteraceae bacterium]
MWFAAAAGVAVAAYAVLSRLGKLLLGRPTRIGSARVHRLHDDTHVDHATGAVRSIQSADVTLPAADLDAIWTPMHLERLARTYWAFLSKATLGLVRVHYSQEERYVSLLVRPLVLLRFRAPEYEMDAQRGIVRWRIERGLLVARRGRGGDGYLEIDARRSPTVEDGSAALHLEVEVANFYPSVAKTFSQWFYAATQSRIHVLVTYGFLRSVAKLDLAESRVGRFANTDELVSR